MTLDLSFESNQLLLNPRLPEEQRRRYELAWSQLVEPEFKNHVGIATSGSTGASLGKLILLSRDALYASARAVNQRFDSGPHDVWMKSLPDFHVGGLGILVRAHLSGAKVYEDRSDKWDPTEFVRQVQESKATLVSLVPTQVFDLVQKNLRAPSSVRAVVVGGGRFENSLRERAFDLGWPCLASYGMTETCSQIATALGPDDPSLVLLSHAQAKTTESGRLEVSASSLLTAQIVFAERMTELIDPKNDGWFISEDRGHVVNGNTLVIEGRAADFVKIGGEGVLVSKLEEQLEKLKLELNYEGDAVVLAAEDDRLGARMILIAAEKSVPSAASQSHSSPSFSQDSVAALVAAFNARVLPFERIRETKIVDAIPRSALGKLLRGAALRLVGLKALTHD